MDVALLVYDFIGGETVDVQVALDSTLLLFGQIVVNAVGTSKVILLNDILPRFVATAVTEIEVDDVVILERLLLLPRIFKPLLTWTTSCAPHVEVDDTSFVWLYNLT